MNALDALIIGVAVTAGLAGWRTGFLARLAAWFGVALGLLAAVPLVAWVVTHFGGGDDDTRLFAATVFLLVAAVIGHAIALGLARLTGHASGPVRAVDRVIGAATGVLGAFALLWMLLPSLAAVPGWPAREARSSAFVSVLDDLAPAQPHAFAVWGRSIVHAPGPSALDPLAEPPDPGAPPSVALPAAIDARVRPSVVLVRGVACDRIQSGTGWVAADHLVVTNAHVVAGERNTNVFDTNGARHAAVVIAFDPRRDVAVLRVSGPLGPPLVAGAPTTGVRGAVYGHPEGGSLAVAPMRVGSRITAVGSDIYRQGSSRRDVLVLAARLAPGDSGGPVLDRAGRVVGMAFAVDPANAGTAYALTPGELDPVVRGARANASGGPVATGRCVLD